MNNLWHGSPNSRHYLFRIWTWLQHGLWRFMNMQSLNRSVSINIHYPFLVTRRYPIEERLYRMTLKQPTTVLFVRSLHFRWATSRVSLICQLLSVDRLKSVATPVPSHTLKLVRFRWYFLEIERCSLENCPHLTSQEYYLRGVRTWVYTLVIHEHSAIEQIGIDYHTLSIPRRKSLSYPRMAPYNGVEATNCTLWITQGCRLSLNPRGTHFTTFFDLTDYPRVSRNCYSAESFLTSNFPDTLRCSRLHRLDNWL